MPLITIQMKQGRSAQQKRALMQGVASAACKAIDVRPEKIRIVITDIKPEDYSTGDQLDLGDLK